MNLRAFALIAMCVVPFAAPRTARAQGGRGAAGTSEILIDRVVAVVGPRVITQTELLAAFYDEIAQRQQRKAPPLPADSAGLRLVLTDMIDVELLLQKGQAMKLSVPDEDVTPTVERRLAAARKDYKSDAEFLSAIRDQGFSSVADLRKLFTTQEHDRAMREKTIDTLTKLGRMPKVPISEKEIKAAYDSLVKNAVSPGPTVTFRQIVINPQASRTADSNAKKLADSLYTALKAGANFDSLARKFSDDSVSAALGGDVGWFRRDSMVAEFSGPAFMTPVGQLAPVVKSRYGYHVIRVDRVKPGSVRARHILISPKRDSGDVVRARTSADSAATALRAGASFDTLVARYHDPAEERLLSGYPFNDIPENYKSVMGALKPNEVSKAFEIPTATWPKIAFVQLVARNESGIPTLAEQRERIRTALQGAASMRHLLDALRRETYVSVKLDQPPRAGQ